MNYKKPTFWIIMVAVAVCIVIAVCFLTNPNKISVPDNPIVFSVHDNPNGYIEYHWEEKGLVYVPYMPLNPELAGDCIGYDEYNGEFVSYVCMVADFPETEWICDVSSDTVNGHTAGMIMREINVKKVPEGWESEYEWNYVEEAESTESVTDWMDIELPRGYYLSQFYDDIGYMGGSLILPRSYYADDSDSAPSVWQYSGFISRLPVESGMATVTFDNGIPNPASAPLDNHTVSEYVKTIGLERSNMRWPAIMLRESHDLYTASQLNEMEESGIDISGKDITSDYWVFWFVKEGEDKYYVLTLSAREFSQEEAEVIASGVVIK